MKLLNESEYPSELIIAEDTYKVRFVKKMPDGCRDTVGLCDFSERTIYLKKGMSQAETLKTFIHEILHAICEEHKIKVSHKAIYRLEEAVYAFFVGNF